MKQLAPKAVWLFFVQSLMSFIFIGIFFGLYLGVFVLGVLINSQGLSIGVSLLPILLLGIILVFSFVWAKLSYNNYKYELREDGFRKEHGVIWKKYVSIPYERIQNVDIYRGVFARLLGLSDLHIQTAGMSAVGGRWGLGAATEGRLPGVSVQDAESLRDELIKRSKGQQPIQNQATPQPNQSTQQGL